MIRAVFFDVGDVLLAQDSTVLAANDREHGWVRGTSAEIWKAHLRVAHLGAQPSPSEDDGRIAQIRRRLYATNRVVSGVEGIIRGLKSRCRVAVISNFTTDLKEVLDQMRLLPYSKWLLIRQKSGRQNLTKRSIPSRVTLSGYAIRDYFH